MENETRNQEVDGTPNQPIRVRVYLVPSLMLMAFLLGASFFGTLHHKASITVPSSRTLDEIMTRDGVTFEHREILLPNNTSAYVIMIWDEENMTAIQSKLVMGEIYNSVMDIGIDKWESIPDGEKNRKIR